MALTSGIWLNDVADGGGVVGLFSADAEAGAVECAEVDGVIGADGLAGGEGLPLMKVP